MPQLTRRALRPLILALVVATAVVAVPTPAGAQEGGGEDPALKQRIDAHQRLANGTTVLEQGHIDVGPLFVDGHWTLMIHDDTRKAQGGRSIWRHPEQTVLHVNDAGRLKAPDDPAYAFLHAKPGAPVYVVPETQDRDVVWVGWNTQDPTVMQRIDRGATMTMTGVQGPGTLVVYLQSGSFSEPKVLWDSTAAKPDPVWLDVNTHTHANWVFTKPGVYLVQFRIAADLIDGTKVTDTRELRFAVGTTTSTDDALAAQWRGAKPATDAETTPDASSRPASDDEGSGGEGGWLIAIIAVAALGLIAALALAVVRGGRAKRQARQAAIRRPVPVDDEPDGGAS